MAFWFGSDNPFAMRMTKETFRLVQLSHWSWKLRPTSAAPLSLNCFLFAEKLNIYLVVSVFASLAWKIRFTAAKVSLLGESILSLKQWKKFLMLTNKYKIYFDRNGNRNGRYRQMKCDLTRATYSAGERTTFWVMAFLWKWSIVKSQLRY